MEDGEYPFGDYGVDNREAADCFGVESTVVATNEHCNASCTVLDHMSDVWIMEISLSIN